jgi:Bacterial mobilisation protein (MobC)
MTPKKEKLRRTSHITIRLSADERIALDEASARAGLMTGSYVRQRIFDGPTPRQVRRPQVEREELARILGELGKIGSNLNQLAKASNSGVAVYHHEILVVLGGLKVMKDTVITAMGREP